MNPFYGNWYPLPLQYYGPFLYKGVPLHLNFHYPYYLFQSFAPYQPLLSFNPAVMTRTPNSTANQYPAVNPDIFMDSAEKALSLISDATILLNKMKSSKGFSTELMNFAQKSKTKEVERLIKSVGIKKVPEVEFNPDGLILDFRGEAACCYLTLKVKWGQI